MQTLLRPSLDRTLRLLLRALTPAAPLVPLVPVLGPVPVGDPSRGLVISVWVWEWHTFCGEEPSEEGGVAEVMTQTVMTGGEKERKVLLVI